jgi:outer membrane protein assembly factor BamB
MNEGTDSSFKHLPTPPVLIKITRRLSVLRRYLPLVVFCLSWPALAVADWPTHRGNAQRTGNIDGKPGPTKPKLLWHHLSQSQFVSSPAISDKGNVLYLSGLDAFNSGIFYAIATDLKAASRVLWSKNPPYLQKPAVSSPVLADGLLFFGDGMHQTDGASLYCLKADSGLPIWKFYMPGNLVHMEGAPVVDKGKVYMGAGNGGVFCVELGRIVINGKEHDLKEAQALLQKKWKELEDQYEKDKKKDPDTAIPPSPNDLPQAKPKLLWQQGKEKWHVDSSLAVAKDRVFATTAFLDMEKFGERALLCLKASDGSQVWKAPLDFNPWAGATIAGNVALVGCSSIRLDPAELAQAKGEVIAVDIDKGNIVWKKKLPGGVVSSIAVHDNVAVVTATDGKVRAYDVATGNPRWTYSATAAFFAGAAIAGKAAYVADLKGIVHAINLEQGTKLWTLDLPAHPAIKSPGSFYGSPIVHDGKIYLATCNLHGETAWRPTVVVCIGEG